MLAAAARSLRPSSSSSSSSVTARVGSSRSASTARRAGSSSSSLSRRPLLACAPAAPFASGSSRTPRTSNRLPRTMFALTPFRTQATATAQASPRTFSQQDKLPRLPVPALEDSLPRYLRSLEPILRQKEARGELPLGSTAQSELQKRQQWAEQALAPGSLTQRLQTRLQDVDRTSPTNWLDDRFWLQKAYHEWRVPLLVNSNWWLMFRAERGTPAGALEFGDVQPEVRGDGAISLDAATAMGDKSFTDAKWGVRRATWVASRLLEFKRRLDREEIMPDASRTSAFCMHQYTRLFGVTRIPALPHDWNTNAPMPPRATHISVLARNNVYALEVLAEPLGETLPLAAIEKGLWDIIADAKKADGKAIGVLSSQDRDSWAKDREHLMSISPKNVDALRSLEDSLFCLSLDSDVLPVPTSSPQSLSSATPSSVHVHARNVSGAGRGGHNRWFDKALTVVMEPNGRGGINGEHSPCDALIPSIVIDFALAEPAPKPDELFPGHTSDKGFPATPWRKLEWHTDETVDAAITRAQQAAKELCDNSDMGMLWFDEYGAEWIKKVGKQSPDAYLQMALQLAFATVTGKQSATYETASTRSFKHGRTDVIRSFSNEAYDFVQAVREKKPAEEVYRKLSAATKAHNDATRASSTGRGFDRHLTGLRLVYDAAVDGAPEEAARKGAQLLLGDELLAESQTWLLSTSGLSAGDRFSGTGFGSGYEEGLGTNYLAGASLLKFGLEAKRSAPWSSTPLADFAAALVDALRTMRTACEQGAPSEPPAKERL